MCYGQPSEVEFTRGGGDAGHALRIKICSDTMSCQLQKWPDMSGHATFTSNHTMFSVELIPSKCYHDDAFQKQHDL